MIVWNYGAEQISILEVTQASIIGEIVSLANDEDWGDPKGVRHLYSKDGRGHGDATTPYQAQEGSDLKRLRKHLLTLINLMALFSGDDPFAPVSGAKKDPF